MTTDLCLLAVHAHTDDEAIPTGGTLPSYAERSVRTVLAMATRPYGTEWYILARSQVPTTPSEDHLFAGSA